MPTHSKAILFDLDGTLVDSNSTTYDAFNHAIERFTGKRVPAEEIARHFPIGEGGVLSRLLGPERAEEAYQLALQYMNDHRHDIPLHDGVTELLDRIRAAGIPTSVVTGRSWGTTEIILKQHAILDRFVAVVADDHVSSPKPSPEGLHLALSRMGIEPANALYVGDSGSDIRAARAAGSQAVAALWDTLARRESLAPHGPHHWASHPRQIWEIWGKFARTE
jgi:HAD superfamily hydrolase (TIGR01509 family)